MDLSSEKDAEFGRVVDEIQDAIEREAGIIYSKKVIQEANNPQNVGRMPKPDIAGEITGPCGDTMEFYLKIEGDKISDIKFYTDGCGPTIACGSMTTKLVKDKGIEEAGKITSQDIIDALDGMPEENLHCGKLAADALQKAIENYREERA